jgi:hypothetical protein
MGFSVAAHPARKMHKANKNVCFFKKMYIDIFPYCGLSITIDSHLNCDHLFSTIAIKPQGAVIRIRSAIILQGNK